MKNAVQLTFKTSRFEQIKFTYWAYCRIDTKEKK